ncbi:unnamed protein product [Durusdinium trenchii]|uniref:Smr domain-containing protein n=1 Tax=Durusdinium trenchii TaxID=1381693 RepID=A0ABP0STJ3_9DINO
MPVLPLQARSRVLRLASLRHSQFLWAAARRSFSGAGPGLHLWAENARREVFARLHGLRKSKATPQEVLFIVSECQRRQLLKDPRDWVVAMSSLGHVGLWTDTLALFEAMHLETAVAVHAFNATLSAVQRAQQWEAAVALFADIERYSLTPDTVTCNALLTACDKGGQWQSALSLLERIGPTYHLQPNVVSYSTTLSACERGRAWEHALQVFANMNGCEISPDVVVFNATLSALDGGSRWEEALTLLEEMNEIKLKRTLATYGSAIRACGNAFQWEEAVELMRSLQNRQKPNLIILNLCLDACRKARNLHAALKLFNDMQIESERPDMLSYTSLISACGYGAEWQLAIQLHEDALMTGQPDIFSFNAVLGVCRQASRWEESHRILEGLLLHGLSPSMPTYKALIAACAYAMRWSDALSHLRALQKSDSLYIGAARGKEDLILQFGIVSKACAEAGLASRSQALVDEAEFAAAAKGLAGRLPREWISVLHWQAALAYFQRLKQAIDRDDTEEGVQVVGLADLLLDAGQDTAAMSLLLEAQEAQIFSLWQKTKKADILDLHSLGPGSCSAAVAEAAVSAALLQLAEKRAFRATRGFVVVTGRGLGSLRTSPLLLPAISSFLSQLGLDIRQATGFVFVPRRSLHDLWQGVKRSNECP